MVVSPTYYKLPNGTYAIAGQNGTGAPAQSASSASAFNQPFNTASTQSNPNNNYSQATTPSPMPSQSFNAGQPAADMFNSSSSASNGAPSMPTQYPGPSNATSQGPAPAPFDASALTPPDQANGAPYPGFPGPDGMMPAQPQPKSHTFLNGLIGAAIGAVATFALMKLTGSAETATEAERAAGSIVKNSIAWVTKEGDHTVAVAKMKNGAAAYFHNGEEIASTALKKTEAFNDADKALVEAKNAVSEATKANKDKAEIEGLEKTVKEADAKVKEFADEHKTPPGAGEESAEG